MSHCSGYRHKKGRMVKNLRTVMHRNILQRGVMSTKNPPHGLNPRHLVQESKDPEETQADFQSNARRHVHSDYWQSTTETTHGQGL